LCKDVIAALITRLAALWCYFLAGQIDITIQDAMRRRHQCATIQLDFQLPNRFDLKFQAYVAQAQA